MKGYEKLEIENEFTRLMRAALKENKELLDAVKNANKQGYAITFSLINGICWASLEKAKAARERIMKE